MVGLHIEGRERLVASLRAGFDNAEGTEARAAMTKVFDTLVGIAGQPQVEEELCFTTSE